MASLDADDVALSDPGFWARSLSERYRAFRLLREHRPVGFFPEPPSPFGAAGPGFWAVTRHVDVLEVSRQPEVFCSSHGATSVADLPVEMRELFGSIIEMDDPRHARLRRIVSRGFTPKMLATLDDSIQAIARSVIDDLLAAGGGDFVDLVAAPLPLRVICNMMGVPESEYAAVLRCTNVILSQGDPEYVSAGTPIIEAYLDAAQTLAGIVGQVARARRAEPTGDVTSALVNADVDGERLTEAELASFFILLLVAGSETTRTATSHALFGLTAFPDQRRLWMDDLAGVTSTAVDELVRWSTPVIAMRRTATRHYVLAGQSLAEGDKVILLYASANRDETVFAAPDALDLGRHPNPHVGFGGPGPHFCLGAHLARRELGVLFAELLTRAPSVHAVGEPDRLRSSFINGIKHLACAL